MDKTVEAAVHRAKTETVLDPAAGSGAGRRIGGRLRRALAGCLGDTGPVARILISGRMRVAVGPGRPGYRAGSADPLRAEERAACTAVARLLGAVPVFVICATADLGLLLARGRADVAIGGLVQQPYAGIRWVPLTVPGSAATGNARYRQVLFPTVCWVSREHTLWFLLLRVFMALRRCWLHRLRS